MFKGLFGKGECHDPASMSIELHDIRLVNLGTALEVDLKVRNIGVTELTIHTAHLGISVAKCEFKTETSVVESTITGETRDGQIVKVLVQAPFLQQPDLTRMLKEDGVVTSYQASSIPVSISSFSIKFTRVKTTIIREELDLRDHQDWVKHVKGVHHFLAKDAA